MPSSIKDRYPLNKGDFYINNGDCITCGAPQAEAPDLIEHGKDGHCYFKRQPQTETELDQAINALMVSCINALRYGGMEEKILKRLYEDGMADLCDHTPEGKYSILIRDWVSFNFEGLMDELSGSLMSKFTSWGDHITINEVASNNNDHFSFVKRWAGGDGGIIYEGIRTLDNTCILQISPEKGRRFDGMIGTATSLHEFLKVDPRITNIKWFARDMPADQYYDKPF